MRVTFHASEKLPDDVAVALVPGEFNSSLLLNVSATADEIADALTAIMRQWVDDEWIYVGRVSEPHLRAI